MKLPDSTLTQFKWLKIYGDGNQSSQICQADITKDWFYIQTTQNYGTEVWFDGFGMDTVPGYVGEAHIHCGHCVDIRVTGMWFSNSRYSILSETDNEITKVWGNTFEHVYNAVLWKGPQILGHRNWFLDMKDNVIDGSALNWFLGPDGNALLPYAIDLTNISDGYIANNIFLGVGRGIRCADCSALRIVNNDFEQMGIDIYNSGDLTWYAWQALSLSGSGSGLSRRTVVTGNHFVGINSEAVDLLGNNSSILFEGNTYGTPVTPLRPYMSWTAANGSNGGIIVTHEIVDSCASPCISIASGAMSLSTISSNYFAQSITTPITVTGGVPSGSYVALKSHDAAAATLTVDGCNGCGNGTSLVKDVEIDNPVAGNDSAKVQLTWSKTGGATLQRVWCSTDQGTLSINFDVRTEAAPDTPGTNILSSNLVCNSTTATANTFAVGVVPQYAPLNLQINAAAGSPGIVRLHISKRLTRYTFAHSQIRKRSNNPMKLVKTVITLAVVTVLYLGTAFAQNESTRFQDRLTAQAEFAGQPQAESFKFGPNTIHVEAWHADGTKFADTVSHNLKTTAGMDAIIAQQATTGAQPAAFNYICLSNDATAPAAGDTVVAGEINNTNALGRAQATYAHTGGTSTYTLVYQWTASGAQTNIQKAGVLNAASVGTLLYEGTFTSTSLNSGDKIQVTWTVTGS